MDMDTPKTISDAGNASDPSRQQPAPLSTASTPKASPVTDAKITAAIAAAQGDVAERAVAQATVEQSDPAPLANTSNQAEQKKPAAERFLSTRKTTQERTKMATASPKRALGDKITDAQEKAKAAYAKGSEVAGQLGDLVKDSADAFVDSGKALRDGIKQIGEESLADSRQAVQTFADDLKQFAAVKSPAELFRLQGELAGRNFDAALKYAAKNRETVRTLASKVFSPLSERTKSNLETLRKPAS